MSDNNIINLTTEQISFAVILLSEYPYNNMSNAKNFKDALNMVNTYKFNLQQINDIKELISDFLFELITICDSEDYFKQELDYIKNSEEYRDEFLDLVGEDFGYDDFKNLVEQINSENEDSINKFYQKDYKTFRKLIEGYGAILEENGSILEMLKYISKTSSVGSLLSYFLDNGDLEGAFDED